MVAIRKLRELALEQTASAGRPAHLSAASGLLQVGEYLYVNADDELHLGVFPTHGEAPGSLARLFEGELPEARDDRKALKPDLEALLQLPGLPAYPHGALLALPSGSKPQRRRAALCALDEQGRLLGQVRVLDTSLLYDALEAHIDKLNIEGAVLCGSELWLLQRGNSHGAQNAVLRLDLPIALRALKVLPGESAEITPHIQPCELGKIGDTRLGFTDATALPDGCVLYSAVAENTSDNYFDGACAGSVLGLLSPKGQVLWQHTLADVHKVEGISARVVHGKLHVLMVTDADDPAQAASLLSAQLDYPGVS